jgi:carbonic anhydrase
MYPPKAAIALLLLSSSSLLAPLSLVSAEGDAAFNYNPLSDAGPSHWADLPVDHNECGGLKNSPIAIESSPCDAFVDYKFTVSASASM